MAHAFNDAEIVEVPRNDQPYEPPQQANANMNNNNNNDEQNEHPTVDIISSKHSKSNIKNNASSLSSSASQKLSSFTNSIKSGTKTMSDASSARLSLTGQLKQARISLEQYVNPKIMKKAINKDTMIPKWVLRRAKGLVFMTVIKAGFLFAGNVGTGCVIVRKKDGWSGPSSVGVAGVSFGFLAGASKIDYIMILPDEKAVKQFIGKGQIRLGGELQLALGPLGRDANGSVGAGDGGYSMIYSYSHAKGLYGGVSLDGKIISVRSDCNKRFYKKSVDCADVLSGNVDIPKNDDYDMIVHLLDSYCLDDDMTPIKGEKLSINDMNNVSLKDESDDNKESKMDDTNNNNNNITQRMSSSFNKFTKSVSRKFIDLTSSSSTSVSASNEKDVNGGGNGSNNKNQKNKEYFQENDDNNNNNNDNLKMFEENKNLMDEAMVIEKNEIITEMDDGNNDMDIDNSNDVSSHKFVIGNVDDDLNVPDRYDSDD